MSYCTSTAKESWLSFPLELNQIEDGISSVSDALVELNLKEGVTVIQKKPAIANSIRSGQPDTAISLPQNFAISTPTAIQLSLTISLPIKQYQEEGLAVGDRWRTLCRNQDTILEMVQFWIDNRLLSDLFKYRIFQLYFLYRSSGR